MQGVAKNEERDVYGNTLSDEVYSATRQIGIFEQSVISYSPLPMNP
jgi:hypothetical protein